MAVKRGTTISYKNTTKDLKLYNVISNMEDKSAELKGILYKVLVLGYEVVEKKGSVVKTALVEVENNDIDILDF